MIMTDQTIEAYVAHLENEIDMTRADIQWLSNKYLHLDTDEDEARQTLDQLINTLVSMRQLLKEYQNYEASV